MARLIDDRLRTARLGSVLHWQDPYIDPDAPLGQLAQHLATLGKEADRLGSHPLKLTVLYLQARMYGPAETFHRAAYAPSVLVTDRHPLVTAPVYLPFYRRALAADTDSGLPPKVHDYPAPTCARPPRPQRHGH
ncbi:hypothetical protein GCM10010245_87310 [Streptomyces spectabilis]|uniref:Uncharacterized protein n=1 Tax=Streptomyces spectabilis TaxID=68270 RepID=A0A7W8EY18_STRST|nr:hypothetical protein [Streptomyces spectabilis]MBB5109662.1 hypothetical protein [Streptomyces spectabilis]GGV55157.1 hypothetical protein GCM10010245_87310 [Streptomyces spectabilis]